MRKLLLAVFAILVIGSVTAVVLILNIDGERFRPQLVEVARSQADLELGIGGTLQVRLWPDIALEVTDVSVRWVGDTHPQPLLRADSISFRAALLPLLSLTPSLQMREINVAGSRINLAVDANGADNWTPPGSKTPPPEPPPASDAAFDFRVERVRIADAAVVYSDARDGTSARLERFNLTLDTGAADDLVPLQLSGRGAVDDQLEVDFKGTARAGIGATMTLRDLQLDLTLSTPELSSPLHVAVTGAVVATPGERVQLNALGLRVEGIQASLDGEVLLAGSAPEVALSVRIPAADPRELLRKLDLLPAFTDTSALRSLDANTTISGSAGRYRLDPLNLTADDVKLSGWLSADTSAATPMLRFDLRGGVLNLDRYSTAAPTTAPSGPLVDDAPLPLEQLDTAFWEGQLQLARLVSGSIDVGPISITSSNVGQRMVNRIAVAEVFSGKATAEATLDRDAARPAWNLLLDASGLRAEDLAPAAGFIGPVGVGGRLSAIGASSGAITDSLTGTLQIDGATGTLDVTSLKAGLLSVARLLGRGERLSRWPDRLQYQSLSGRLQFRDGVDDQTLILAVDNLQLDANGGMDLRAERFDYQVAATLTPTQPATFDVHPDLLGVRWPLRCRSQFGAAGNPCGLDADGARVLVTQLMSNQALDPLRQQVEDKLPEGARQLLRGLFGTPRQN